MLKTAGKYLLIAFRVFMWPLYYLSGFFPRNAKIWAFGANNDSFTDNAKHLHLHVSENRKEIKAVWLSGNRELVRSLRQKGLSAHYRWGIEGILASISAEYYFFNSYSSDINFWLSRGAVLVNLWHGIPLKKIEFDIENGPLAGRYHPRTVFHTLLYKAVQPWIYKKPDSVLASSEGVARLFSSAFRMPMEKCLISGYPRTDILFFSREKLLDFIDKFEDAETARTVEMISRFKKTIIYMPTWRDEGGDFIKLSGIDFQALNDVLHKKNYLFILKLHLNTGVDLAELGKFSNIHPLSNKVDVYPILPFTSALVTDYSSIFFDYLLLNREMIFFPFDYEKYCENRGFYFDFNDVSPGKKVFTFAELLGAIEDIESLNYSEDRKKTKEMFWKGYSGTGSQNIARHFKIKP